MNKKTMKDIKQLSADLTGCFSTCVRATGYVVLLKLLYKQKIKPITAIALIAAYNLNDGDTNEMMYKRLKSIFMRAYEVENEVKEEKCMGFSIK